MTRSRIETNRRRRSMSRVAGAVTLAVAAGAGTLAVLNNTALPALAQARRGGIERVLVGIRLNTSAKNVLARYGNPNEVIVGEVGVRLPGGSGGAAAGSSAAGAGFGPAGEGATLGGGGGYPGGGQPSGYPGSGGGKLGVGGGSGLGEGATPGGSFGGSSSPGAGFGGFGGAPGAAAGGGTSTFGQTTSTLSRQQEVTWIYNRQYPPKTGNVVSYEFLISPRGQVSQIRALGYKGGSVRTVRGIGLGATYQQVIAKYGYPELHQQVGPVLVMDYRAKSHAEFQLMNNKVFAITIATIE